MTDWIEWHGAAKVPEPVKTAKRLWVRYSDGFECEKRLSPRAVKVCAWQQDAFLWMHGRNARSSSSNVIAYRVE